jgi:hypothetical protein
VESNEVVSVVLSARRICIVMTVELGVVVVGDGSVGAGAGGVGPPAFGAAGAIGEAEALDRIRDAKRSVKLSDDARLFESAASIAGFVRTISISSVRPLRSVFPIMVAR